MKHRSWVSVRTGSAVIGALACCALSTSTAEASAPVVVPPVVEPGQADVVEVAIAELIRQLKLSGFDAISPGQAGPSAEHAQEAGQFSKEFDPFACSSAECAAEYRQLFDAAFAVQLAVTREGARAGRVSVVLTEGASVYFAGEASVEGGDVRGAVKKALELARKKQADGVGPWFHVEGMPEGGMVYVDGEEFGRVPIEKRHIAPGGHVVEVRHDGFTTERYALQIPNRIDHEEHLDVALSSLAGADVPPPKLDRTWDYVAGGTIMAVGAAHLVLGAYQQARFGDCAERAGGTCVAHYGDNQGVSQEKLLIGLGAAGMVLGAAVAWVAPIGRLQLKASSSLAYVTWGGGF